MERRQEERPASLVRKRYSTGTYGALNTLRNTTGYPAIELDRYSDGFADYRMTADEYTQTVLTKYRTLTDSIASSQMPDLLKEECRLTLRQQTVAAMADARYLMEYSYRSADNLWRQREIDYKAPALKPEHYAALCASIDINAPKLLAGVSFSDYRHAVIRPDIDWPTIAEVTEDPVIDLRTVGQLPKKAENDEPMPAAQRPARSRQTEKDARGDDPVG